VVTTSDDIVQCYCVGCVEYIVVIAKVDIVQWYCVVWSILWLQQQ